MDIIRILYLNICILTLVLLLYKHLKSQKGNNNCLAKLEELVDPGEETWNAEDLKYNLDKVTSWVGNCDQKVCILLSIVGVATSILLSSDFVQYLYRDIFQPFLLYCDGNSDFVFSCGRFVVFILFLSALLLLIFSTRFFLKSITANTDYDNFFKRKPSLAKTSYLFFGTISAMSYEQFKNPSIDIKEDLLSQIFVNSDIAKKKFENYNKGLFLLRLLLLTSLMLFIAIMFI